jgi:putative hydrolase
MLISAIVKNPCVDMITHPNDTTYPIDYIKLCKAAARYGVAIELNNSRTLYKRSSDATTVEMINACIRNGCRMAVASDTHAIQELGDDSAVAPLLESTRFPDELLVTLNAESVHRFLSSRKKHKHT